MARNIEIKARVGDLARVERLAAAISGGPPQHIAQDDTFFNCSAGRLKLRAFSDGSGELIFYQRSNLRGPKESFYVRSPTASPDTLRDALRLSLGECGRVKKARTLYLAGRTRIHVDRVDALGSFLELEVVLQEHESQQSGIDEARALMQALGVESDALVEGAYVDLLAGAADALERRHEIGDAVDDQMGASAE